MEKRTKVIATLGPAVDGEGTLEALFRSGVDIVRLNFSHGTYDEHEARIDRVKRVRERLELPVAIMLDTKGPEIRTGLLEGGGPVLLEEGSSIVLTPTVIEGNAGVVHQTYPELYRHVKRGLRILLDDGLIELEVKGVDGKDVVCEVLDSGELGQRKSLNVPGVALDLPALTDKDRSDLLFGIEQDVDFVAASFIKDRNAVEEIKGFLRENAANPISVIAKIENKSAVEDIDGIVQAADGVMIARGDLGVELPAQEVPILQKRICAKCNMYHKPVITATQMLESMTHNPRPTRAEAADVANAIYDGTDCVMLSGETAVGEHPVEAVRTMVQIIEATEEHYFEDGRTPAISSNPYKTVSLAVGSAAVQTAKDVMAKCLICPTMTGRTARLMSSLRAQIPIYSVTPDEHVLRHMQIYWGVKPLLGDVKGAMRCVIGHACDVVISEGYAEIGDVAVLTCGDRFTSPITLDDDGNIEKFAPANVMYVVQMRGNEISNALADCPDNALMTRAYFDKSHR